MAAGPVIAAVLAGGLVLVGGPVPAGPEPIGRGVTASSATGPAWSRARPLPAVTVTPARLAAWETLTVRSGTLPRRVRWVRLRPVGSQGSGVARCPARRTGPRTATSVVCAAAVGVLRVVGDRLRPTRLQVQVVGAARTRWTARHRSPVVSPPATDPDASAPLPAPGAPPVDGPVPTTALLGPDDLTYAGAFRLPERACGWSTAYSSAGLALRRVGDQVRLMTAAHVYSGGLVYEVAAPAPVVDAAGWPVAELVGEPCDVYAGRRQPDEAAPTGDGETWTHGLHYDAGSGRLYWGFGEYYNADASDDRVLGYTDLTGSGDPGAAHGPWRGDGTAHAQRLRGGVLGIPADFADAHLGGRRLGIGFGGYYSIVGQGSFGPALYAIDPPGDGTDVLQPLPLLEHPAAVSRSDTWAWRPATYAIDPGLDWGRAPDGDRGYWAPGDSIEGAATWVADRGRAAVLFAAELNTGLVWYGDGGLHGGGTQTHLYAYDPADLAEVAAGRLAPWQPRPRVWALPLPAMGEPQDAFSGATRRVTGMAYDPAGDRLYLLQLNGYTGDVEQYPVVHVFDVRGS